MTTLLMGRCQLPQQHNNTRTKNKLNYVSERERDNDNNNKIWLRDTVFITEWNVYLCWCFDLNWLHAAVDHFGLLSEWDGMCWNACTIIIIIITPYRFENAKWARMHADNIYNWMKMRKPYKWISVVKRFRWTGGDGVVVVMGWDWFEMESCCFFLFVVGMS